jgi:hypothetical protein
VPASSKPLVLTGALAIAAGAALAGAPGPAAADPSLTCERAAPDAVDVDGMLDDWDGVAHARAGGTDRDASFDLRCLYDGARLVVSVDIRDERVVRAKGKGGDDRLELTLAAGGAPLALSLEPGVDRIAPRRKLGGKALPGWVTVEDTLQERGWSAELALRLAKVPGWGPGVATLSLAVTVADADVAKVAVSERTVSWSGALALGQAAVSQDRFLREAGLGPTDITLDVKTELDRASKGPERFVAGKDVIAVVTDHIAFVNLPVERAADVLEVKLVDLRGDGSKVVATRLRQRGAGAARELLTLWNLERGQLHPLGAIELGKQRGDARLTSTFTVEPARRWKQARGAKQVLVVRAQPAVGWDEDSYREAPAVDAVPVHVPWDDDRIGGVFWLDADDALRSADLKR